MFDRVWSTMEIRPYAATYGTTHATAYAATWSVGVQPRIQAHRSHCRDLREPPRSEYSLRVLGVTVTKYIVAKRCAVLQRALCWVEAAALHVAAICKTSCSRSVAA